MAQHESSPVSCNSLSGIPELVDKDANGSLRVQRKGSKKEMEDLKRILEEKWPRHFSLETRPSADDPDVWELSLTHL